MKKGNTIVICSDQHHFRYSGYRGHQFVKTPNLDALTKQGTSFNNCYCNSPVCTPSRMSFITGKHVHQIGSWFIHVPLDENEPTWASRLSDAGVESTMFGKMDFCGSYQSGGFDKYKIADRRAAFSPYPCISSFPARLKDYVRPDKRSHLKNAGIRKPLVMLGGNYYHDAVGFYDHDCLVTDWAKTYLHEKSNETEPWILYLGYVLPHWPYICPEEYFNMYYPDNIEWPYDCVMPENLKLHPAIQEFQRSCDFTDITEDDMRRTLAAYYGLITCMDNMIGEVFHTLKELGMYDDTTIIYTSDHGESCGEHGLFYKQCAYDGSVAVPLIAKGPDIAKNHVVDTPVSLVDLYPTLLDLYELEVESDRPGKSWMPFFHGKTSYDMDYVFAEYHGNFFRDSWYMIVKEDYKYVYYVSQRPSLFNLKDDPQEMFDLALESKYKTKLDEFENLLRTYIDPEEVDWRSKKDLGLISPDGEDLTQTLTVNELEEAIKNGEIPPVEMFCEPLHSYYHDFFNEH